MFSRHTRDFLGRFTKPTTRRMAAVFTNSKAEPDLYQHEVQVKTRDGKSVAINCVFMDTKPGSESTPTVVAVHGAPGSHKDFKYIVPELNDVRFIGINWPGMGYSSYEHSLADDNDERVQVVQQIIDHLRLQKIVFVGHSRGSENALKMAALNKDRALGSVMINPICLRPHKGVRPYWIVCFFAWLWKVLPFAHGIFNPLLYWLYQTIGLRTPDGKVAGVCLSLMRYADFAGQKRYIDMVNDSNVRTLKCSASRDFLVEPRLSKEFANSFSGNQELICSGEDDSEIAKQMKQTFKERHQHVSVLFEKDGHFLQKTRATFLAQAIQFLLSSENPRKAG